MSNEAQTKCALGLVPGQPGRRVQHGFQTITLRQFAILGGNAAGDFLNLIAAGKLVSEHHE